MEKAHQGRSDVDMTDEEFITWLANPEAVRCVLVEAVARVGGVETTRYMSDMGYVTAPTDTPANRAYESVIIGGCEITEEIDISGRASLTVGDIEIDNTEGDRDDWLDDVWKNRAVSMYFGDMRWPRADFRKVFYGIAVDLTSRARGVLNLQIRDKLELLNTAVTSTRLGGASANAERLLPLTFGEVHNILPLLIDKATLKYQYHQGASERCIEVRDNGVVVSKTDQLASGTFTLSASPAGTITTSVQGDKPSVYYNTVAKLVERVVTGYGTNPFVGGDIDSANFTAFDAANTQPIGTHLKERENVIDVIHQMSGSVGAVPAMNALGLLQLIKIALPAAGTSTEVTEDNIVAKSFQLDSRVPVKAACKIAYCKNWTVQENLQTGIPPEHASLYGQEWLYVTSSDSAVATIYKLTQAPEPEETLLLTQSTASAEALRRRDLWKVQRSIYRYDGLPELMLEPLGGPQTLSHTRYGLSAGADAQILSVTRKWLTCGVSFKVLI